jgi:hypothetical protein
MDDSLWYENNTSPALNGYVNVDRVYCLSFSEFTERNWSQLSAIYTSLPGWAGSGTEGLPHWFGLSETPPYIYASVELSGLHIVGSIPQDDLQLWHHTFLESFTNLPVFKV